MSNTSATSPRSWIEERLAVVEGAIEWLGGLSMFAGRAVREAILPPFEFGEILRQVFEIGWRSAPLIILSGVAVGSVLSMHTRATLERFGAEAIDDSPRHPRSGR